MDMKYQDFINSPLTNGKSVLDQDIYLATDDLDITDDKTPEQTTDEMLMELLTILRPLAPFIAALPELMEKVDPLMEGIKNSPVTRMMGIRIP